MQHERLSNRFLLLNCGSIRLNMIAGANRVIVRALRIMSERLREQGLAVSEGSLKTTVALTVLMHAMICALLRQ